MGIWLVLVLSVWLCVIECISEDKAAAHVREVTGNWTRYRDLAREKVTVPRRVELKSVLEKHYGVYKDKKRNEKLGLTKTVILIVQLVQKQANNPNPKLSLLNNMICHLERHRLVSMIYLSRYLFDNSESSSTVLESHFVPNDNMIYVPYPDLDFWDMLVTRSKTSSTPIKQTARYSYPNFREYGDKSVLFAVLELLRVDLNVILLDDDVMLLRDPVPFLANRNITADIVTPEDTRQCVFISNPLLSINKWKSMQPEINLGVTFFRSRSISIRFVQRWMNMVEYNGQKALFPFRRILTTDNSCHTRQRTDRIFTDDAVEMNSTLDKPKPISICYLSNTLFQNGYVNSFRCGKFNKNPIYSLTISEEIVALRNYFSPNNTIKKVSRYCSHFLKLCISFHLFLLPQEFAFDKTSSVEELEELQMNSADLYLLTPITVHPNYEGKELTIKNYQFWVVEYSNNKHERNPKKCKAFSLADQWKRLNASYSHLFNVIQKRRIEAGRFLSLYQADFGDKVVGTSFFYATEALPIPSVVFRLINESVTGMIFEVFDILPNTFCLTTKHNATADIYGMSLDMASHGKYGPVMTIRASPFSILGDKGHPLVATVPVKHYSYVNAWQ